jgi:hypothetical protein
MSVNAAISNYLGLVPYGKHGIEMQCQGRKIATWQCFGKQNWLRRGATNVDAFCYTVLPADAPESIRLADDDGDASRMPQDDLE